MKEKKHAKMANPINFNIDISHLNMLHSPKGARFLNDYIKDKEKTRFIISLNYFLIERTKKLNANYSNKI